MPCIGFIGIGAKYSRMARRLLAASSPLTVYNRTPAKAQPLIGQDAQAAASSQAQVIYIQKGM
jgi:3-hydroxyisobutyrate dehydrogenase-like beta-hydroxyacid dehydrogenase